MIREILVVLLLAALIVAAVLPIVFLLYNITVWMDAEPWDWGGKKPTLIQVLSKRWSEIKELRSRLY